MSTQRERLAQLAQGMNLTLEQLLQAASSAAIVIHPRAVELNFYAVCSQLKTRGYDIRMVPGARFLRATPDMPPPVRPPPTDTVRLFAPRLRNFWPRP